MKVKANSIARRQTFNSVFTGIMLLFSISLAVPLIFILIYILKNGLAVINLDFFTKLPAPVGVTGGGASNAIVGSLFLVTIAAALSIPFGIVVGVYLHENRKHKFASIVRICSEVLQGVPSIVIGIVAYVWVVVPLGGFSALSGGAALGLMMLPVIIRTTEETLNLIPHSLKEASLALGVPYYKTILRVIIPAAWSGINTGIILGIARIAGETAPLLFTAFGNPFMNLNVTKPTNALPLLIYNYSTSPYQDWIDIAWGASLVLVAFVLFLSLITKVVSRQ